jgi:hypothetical protein
MKRIMIIGLVTCSTSVLAEFPLGNISEFTGSYSEPSGKATASNWEYKDLSYKAPVDIEIEKQAGLMYLSIENNEFEFDQIPKEIEQLQFIDWSAFNLQSDGKKFQLNLESLLGNSVSSTDSHSIDLKKLNIECDNLESTEERTIAEEFLDSCLNNYGNFSVGSMVTVKDGKTETVSNVNFNTDQNKLTFKMKAKGFTLKGRGEIYFEDDSIKIKIDKAKAGMFNAKSKLFKEFKKQESDKLIVNKPWIEIILD